MCFDSVYSLIYLTLHIPSNKPKHKMSMKELTRRRILQIGRSAEFRIILNAIDFVPYEHFELSELIRNDLKCRLFLCFSRTLDNLKVWTGRELIGGATAFRLHVLFICLVVDLHVVGRFDSIQKDCLLANTLRIDAKESFACGAKSLICRHKCSNLRFSRKRRVSAD